MSSEDTGGMEPSKFMTEALSTLATSATIGRADRSQRPPEGERLNSTQKIDYGSETVSLESEGTVDDYAEEAERFVDEDAGQELEEEGIVDEKVAEEVRWDGAEGTERSDEGEEYEGSEYEGEEVGEAEEEIPLSPTLSATEKFVEEVRQVEESDRALDEVPAEVPSDRETVINKLRESLAEQSEIRRRNKLLEIWVFRHMKKTQQKVTPADVDKDAEQMEQIYREAFRAYKIQLDEIVAQEAQLIFEIERYRDKVRAMQSEDERIFKEFLNRQKEVAVGLVYAKTGKKITEKIMNEMIQRQISRREILARDRHNYIFLQHRYEDLNARLRNLETLGEGMTTMDYEALRIINISYKDKLDERNQELEKLRFKIAEVVNGVAHYKEKEVCVLEDIECETRKFDEYSERAAGVREQVNNMHLILRDLRKVYNTKKIEAGLLMAQPQLREMERTMKLLDSLRSDIEIIEHEIRQHAAPDERTRKRKIALDTPIMTNDGLNHSQRMSNV